MRHRSAPPGSSSSLLRVALLRPSADEGQAGERGPAPLRLSRRPALTLPRDARSAQSSSVQLAHRSGGEGGRQRGGGEGGGATMRESDLRSSSSSPRLRARLHVSSPRLPSELVSVSALASRLLLPVLRLPRSPPVLPSECLGGEREANFSFPLSSHEKYIGHCLALLEDADETHSSLCVSFLTLPHVCWTQSK
ncbi:hypothetical protein PR202_ga21522 [Eleusine coracana subsp. coracana]|uniref:Uncharacterized protein n=1 Tax=Eleusine coracana subsp. coracana TaxID=191504 RepID=A0AAV5D0S3_ELECO|nr:hypothetical protein PR202_ga21522 [Eleusine coracana subsp. coracana]